MKTKLCYIGILFLLIFNSCTKETVETTANLNSSEVKYQNKTLNDLKNYNDSIAAIKTVVYNTRTGGGMPWYKADAVGAIIAGSMAGQTSLLFGPLAPKVYVATILLSAAVCSASAVAEGSSAPMLTNDYDDFYRIADYNYRTEVQIPSDTCQINEPLINSIYLPQSYRSLSFLGKNHNAIISDWTSSSNSQTRGAGDLQPFDPGDPLTPIDDLSVLYRDTLFRANYNTTISNIQEVQNWYYGDYVDYLSSTYDNNLSSACELFFQASDYSSNTQELITLINQYISIIEANNDFSSEERKILYGGFIVALYSFDYWN